MHCCPQWRHFGQSSSADRKNGQGSLKHDIKVKLNSCSTSAIKLSNSLRWVITSIIPKSEDQPPFLNAFFAFYPVIDQRQHSNIYSRKGEDCPINHQRHTQDHHLHRIIDACRTVIALDMRVRPILALILPLCPLLKWCALEGRRQPNKELHNCLLGHTLKWIIIPGHGPEFAALFAA